MAVPAEAGLGGTANGVGAADIKRVMAGASRSPGRSADASRHARLWDEHAQRIYRYCFRRTADRELAEDLTSIVFLEAWRRRSKVQLAAEAELPWLYVVATHDITIASRCDRVIRLLDGRILDDIDIPKDTQPAALLERISRIEP